MRHLDGPVGGCMNHPKPWREAGAGDKDLGIIRVQEVAETREKVL